MIEIIEGCELRFVEKCWKCDTVFLYDTDDIHRVDGDPWDSNRKVAACPRCGELNLAYKTRVIVKKSLPQFEELARK